MARWTDEQDHDDVTTNTRTGVQFVFITTSAPKLNKKSRQIVKKHVMKDIGMARRKLSQSPPLNNGKVARTRNLHDSRRGVGIPQSASHTNRVKSEVEEEEKIYAIKDLVFAGFRRFDPFRVLPIETTDEVHQLINHIHDDSHASFKLFREYWFPLAVENPAALNTVVSFAARHRALLYNQKSTEYSVYNIKYLKHHQAAINVLQQKIADLRQCSSDDTIAAIALLACDASSKNAANFINHMAGLKRVVELRGGIHQLSGNKALRLLLFWIDTLGAFIFQSRPVFPAPLQLLPKYSDHFMDPSKPQLSTTFLTEWIFTYPSHIELVYIMKDINTLSILVEKEARTQYPTQEPRFTGFFILPLVHRLLILTNKADVMSEEAKIFTACQLAAFMYLQLVRQFVSRRYPCIRKPFFEIDEYVKEHWVKGLRVLEAIMLGHSKTWTALMPLKCWVLSVAVSMSYSTSNEVSCTEDLEELGYHPDWDDWHESMGCLLRNSWT